MSATITISASFGAGGSVVGRAVADRLGLAFFDRAISATVAERLAVPVQEVVERDERAPSAWSRLAGAFAYAATPLGPQPVMDTGGDPDQYREATERVVRDVADSAGGVILGRAGMVILAGRPDVLRVRLDGPIEARIAQVMALEGLDEEAARRMQHDVDGARDTYAKVFYHARQADPALYHVVMDSTALPFKTCADVVVTAAAAHLGLAVSGSA